MRESLSIRLHRRWARFWMRFSGQHGVGRLACRVAAWGAGGYKRNTGLSRLTKNPFFSTTATLEHQNLQIMEQAYIGEGVILYDTQNNGEMKIGRRSCIHAHTILETGIGAALIIGENTHIQPRCHIAAHLESIVIGDEVQLAQGVGLYSYNHGTELGTKMREQPVTSKGPIRLGDDVWVGFGATILENVTIGDGAIVAAGAVVSSDVPANTIVAGVPAKVVGHRQPAQPVEKAS